LMVGSRLSVAYMSCMNESGVPMSHRLTTTFRSTP